MTAYIVRRLLIGVLTAFLVALFAFGVVRIVPGDALMLQIAETSPRLTPADLARIRAEMGLDKPFVPQFLSWLGGVFRGDLGNSLWTGRPVLKEIARTLPLTLELAVLGLVVATLISLPIGILSAVKRNTLLDYALRFVAILGLSIPEFALAIVAILVLSLTVHWIPPTDYRSLVEDPLTNLQQMLLPALIVGFAMSAVSMRMTRSAMLEVLREDYIRTARAKGLPDRLVIMRHALKNAFIPVITIIGLQARRFMGATVIIETIFALPGLGRLTLDALLNRDFVQLQGNLLVIALLVVLVNLVVDLSYGWLNPRIRYG
ncbi:Dipeptide transport system permease protein DppB [bacterium HR23]|nr:Dipeptide transport system permease protein DppB [bacterium HR23]